MRFFTFIPIVLPLSFAFGCEPKNDAPPPQSSSRVTPPQPIVSASAVAPAPPSSSPTTPEASDPLVGKPAPDFTASSHEGKTIHLAALKGAAVVLYFYPKDETPGCTKEACAFRDSWKEIVATGAVLVGVSMDDAESHRKFAENHKLPFALVSDTGGAIAKLYGVPTDNGFTARQTFVIGADGVTKKVYRKVSVGEHAREILADLKP